MTFLSFFFILASLLSFVVAQLILKRAMVSTAQSGFRNLRFVSRVAIGVFLMTISFFLTLGLLQRFDLSYLYPFQGLSVIIITLMAAFVLVIAAATATLNFSVRREWEGSLTGQIERDCGLTSRRSGPSLAPYARLSRRNSKSRTRCLRVCEQYLEPSTKSSNGQ